MWRRPASRAAYDAAVEQVIATRGGFRAKFAVIGMGRLGGAELSYSSDADVMFVMEPLPDADDQVARADAAAVADLMSRLLGRPSPDPPLEIDANLRPEGQERSAGPGAGVLPGLLGQGRSAMGTAGAVAGQTSGR